MSNAYGDILVTDNFGVLKLWKEGKNARNHHQTLFALDGELLSYHRKIGHRTDAGVCVVADLTLDDVPLKLHLHTSSLLKVSQIQYFTSWFPNVLHYLEKRYRSNVRRIR